MNLSQSNNIAGNGCTGTGQAMERALLEKAAKTAAYALLMLVSLVGNSLILTIVSKKREMWTTTNILIANMAASDLLISLFAIPRAIAETLSENQRWYIEGAFGNLLCKLVYLLQDMSTAVSILSLMTIAVDRFSAIVFPFRRPFIPLKSCKIILPVIWATAFAIHSPYLYTARLNSTGKVTYCVFSWEPALNQIRAQNAYYIFLLAFLIVPPLVIIVTLYSIILFTLRKTNTRPERGASKLRRQEDAKVAKKIVIIMIVFIVCITPINVCAILLYFVWGRKVPCGVEGAQLFYVFKFILFSNASINPCLYFLLYERYKKGLRQLFFRLA